MDLLLCVSQHSRLTNTKASFLKIGKREGFAPVVGISSYPRVGGRRTRILRGPPQHSWRHPTSVPRPLQPSLNSPGNGICSNGRVPMHKAKSGLNFPTAKT